MMTAPLDMTCTSSASEAMISSALLPDWGRWLATLGDEAGFCQTVTWAAINAEANGARPHVVEVGGSGDRRIGALFGLLRETRRGGPHSWLRRLVGRGATGTLDCFEGPAIAPEAGPHDLARFLDSVDALAARLGVGMVRFIAPPTAGWTGCGAVVERAFAARGYAVAPWLTALVDLTVDEETIFARFHRAARKAIRRCEKSSVTVEPCTTEAAFRDDFCATYYAASGKGSIDDPALERRALAMWRLGGGAYRFFVARDADGRVLGTLGSYRFNGVATEIMSARTAEADARSLPVQDLLHWELFRAHKALGDRVFNLAGFSPNPATPKEAGIRRFKEKWGGTVVETPRFTKRFDSPPLALARRLFSRRDRRA